MVALHRTSLPSIHLRPYIARHPWRHRPVKASDDRYMGVTHSLMPRTSREQLVGRLPIPNGDVVSLTDNEGLKTYSCLCAVTLHLLSDS